MRVVALVVVLAGLALGGCGGDDGEDSGTTAPANPSGEAVLDTVEVTVSDFKIEPARIALDKEGVYTFAVRNEGTVDHIFEVEGEGLESETAEIPPGEEDDLTIRLGAGRYKLYCPIGDHEDRGMLGSLTVGGAAGGTSTDEKPDESGSDDDGGYGGGGG